jgi:DNA-binding transcriptional LysR family regulator
MELYQLRTFLMIAEEGHLTRAAKRLNASQPAVSAHIKALEDELGLNLFIRTARGMSLTDDANRLKEHAEKILATVNELMIEASVLKKNLRGELKIGMNSEPESLCIPRLFSKMNEQHPEIKLHLRQSMTGDILNRLEDGILDAGYMYGENSSGKIYTEQLQKLRLVVAGPANWKELLVKAKPEDLGQFPWIMTPDDCPFHSVMSQFFEKHKIAPIQVALVDQESAIIAMIKAGSGLSLVLERDIKNSGEDELAIWAKEEFSLILSIACLTKRKDDPIVEALFSVLSTMWQLKK